MTLMLNPGQHAALGALLRQRQLQQLGQTLAVAMPAVHQRLGDRLADLLTLLADRALGYQLTHVGALARYLACWCALGVEFERKPEHGWALGVLERRGQTQGARAFQLVTGVGEALRGNPAGQAAADAFLEAVAVFDRHLGFGSDLGSLQAAWQLEVGPPCDFDRLLARTLPDPAHLWYVPHATGAERLPPAARPDRCERPWPAAALHAGEPASVAWTDTLTVLAGLPGEASPTTLGLHSTCSHVCDPLRHPLVRLSSASSSHERRGDAARLLSLRLFASRDSLPALPDGRAGIAIAGSPQHQLLETATCGLRQQGAALGQQVTRVAIYPRQQTLFGWQRPARPALRLPDASPPAKAPPTQVLFEQDGVDLPQPGWTERLAGLETAWLAALERLQASWERGSGLNGSVLEDASDFLVGSARLTWGWAYGPDGLAGPPLMRVAASLQLVAARVQLCLRGQFVHQQAACHLTLQFAAEHALHIDWQSPAHAALKPEQMAPVQVQAVIEGTLLTESRAGGEGTLTCRCRSVPKLSARVGLGVNADGPGLQWRVLLQIDPVEVEFEWNDPLLGRQHLPRTLLPKTTLLDWSLP